jgi:hypothetical protein
MPRTPSLLSGSLLVLALLAPACSGDSLAVPETGTLQITTSTTGDEPDPDGYIVQVDAAAAQAIGPAASIQSTDVSPGDHTVQLAGMAANCIVSGDNPRTVSVAAGQTATASFAVTCGATTGSLSITAATSGPSPDSDGYIISIDGADHGALAVNAAVTISGLVPGSHLVGLTGVADNCQVQGDNAQSVTVAAGASASVVYTIICAAPPQGAGSLHITIATTGPDPDANGYTFAIDGGADQPIGVNGTTTLPNLAPGAHSVELGSIAGNCTLQGTNPTSVTVAGGTTTDLNFAISCTATTGTVRVSVTTSGSPTDPDGYVAKLEGADPGKPIATSGEVSFTSVPAGGHTVALTEVAVSCSVTDGASRSIVVAVGATAEVSFVVTCAATTGAMKWTTIPLPSDFVASALWASSPSDIFVVARPRSASSAIRSVLHYDGHAWTESLRGLNGHESPNAVWGSSPTNVFAAGDSWIWRYDGAQWVATSRESELYGAIWGTSPQDVFAVGVADFSPPVGIIRHYDGMTWGDGGSGDGWFPGDAFEVAGSSPTDVYAIGTEDAPPDSPPESDYQTSRLIHYAGSTWRTSFESRSGAGYEGFGLTGVWAVARNDAFFVGSGGQIYHSGGAGWSRMTSPTSRTLRDIWGNANSSVYAVGDDGILHYDGVSWSVLDATPSSRVWGVGTDVFVISEGGAVLHGTP